MLSSDYLHDKRKQKEQKQKQKKVRRNTKAVKLIMHKREEKKHTRIRKKVISQIYISKYSIVFQIETHFPYFF